MRLVSTPPGYFKGNLRETCSALRWCLGTHHCSYTVSLTWHDPAVSHEMPPLWGWSLLPGLLCILSFILILLSSCICISWFSATDVAPFLPAVGGHPCSWKSLCFALCRVFKVVLKQSHSTLVFYFYCDGAYLCHAKSAEVWLFNWGGVFQNSFVWKHPRIFLARLSWSVMLWERV